MEEWEQVIDEYPKVPDVKLFIKVLKTAEVVLKVDLASFELDWVTSTLFLKPVSLFDTVSSKRNDAAWSKPISDAFKLIGDIVDKYPLEHLYENIVTLCLLPFTPQTRKDALSCLTRVARLSAEGARDAQRVIAELRDSGTCKTQLAVLVGVIAECHPELVTDSAPLIWRIYLNLLESNKNTDTVISAVLQGLLGLFKHFGAELPIMEFRDLYEKLSREYILKAKCEEVCLSILEHHANLFKELLATDHRLRQQLWALQACPALLAVYGAIASALSADQMQKILSSEVTPRVHSQNSRLKYTALRVLRRSNIASTSASTSTSNSASTSATDCESASDCSTLAYELRHGGVSIDKADAILWCIESSAPGSDQLLQTAVLFYHNLPVSKRRDIVVHGLLDGIDDVRATTVSFLINESTSPPIDESIDKFLPLWKEIFDSKNGTDSIVLSKSRLVFEDVMEYVFMVMEAVIEEGMEQVPEKLLSLFILTHHILTTHPIEAYTEQACERLLLLLPRLPSSSAAISAAAQAVRHVGGGGRELCQLIRVDKCQDEALLCESCYFLIHAPPEDTDDENVLMAIEILLTRNDVDPTILIQALRRLEGIINESYIDANRLVHLLSLVEQLRKSKNTTEKDARILHRDVIIFMGKYGNNNYITHKEHGNSVIADLKDKLCLNVPNPDEGITYKLNLQRILQLAIIHEDPDALQRLLSVICASLSTSKDPNLQLSLTLVIRALCRAHSHAFAVDAVSIQQAVLLCDSVPCLSALIRYISEEKSPGVRKMVSDALECLLLSNPASEGTEQLVRVTAERAGVMMASEEATIRSGSLSITDTLLSALKDNHLLQTKELPTILTLILETEDLDAKNTFKTAYKILLENLELYNERKRQEIIEKLTKNITKNSTDMSQDVFVKIFKNKVQVTLDFFKDIPNFVMESVYGMIDIEECFERAIYFIAEANLELTDANLEDILTKIEDLDFKHKGKDVFVVEAVLKFLEVYVSGLISKYKEKTLTVIKNTIGNLSPKYIIHLQKHIKSCMSKYLQTIGNPNILITFKDWYQKYNIKSVVENITKENIRKEYTTNIKALRIYIEFMKIPSYVCDDVVLNLYNTVLDIYMANGENYINLYKDYLSDMLYISLRYKTFEELRQHILKSYEKTRLNFVRYFVEVYSVYLLKKPYVLLGSDMNPVCLVLNDILKSALKKMMSVEDSINVLELIDAVWPIYKTQATFQEKHNLLVLTTRLPVQLSNDTAPMQWALTTIMEGGVEGAKLIGVLPGGDECSAAYKSFASRLPVRLSELSGGAQFSFQAMLDAIAATADKTLLNIVAKIANCDESKGWWEEEMASCMAAVARRGDCDLLRMTAKADGSVVEKREVIVMSIAQTLYEDPSLLVCKRLLVPFLRYSTPTFCEKFFSTILDKLLSTISKVVRSARDSYELRKMYAQHAKAYTLIALAIEKIPLATLKSPDSLLYSLVPEAAGGSGAFLMKRACKVCVTARAKPCPTPASDGLQDCYRQFQIANYKCLTAAVCVMRPAAKFYTLLFQPDMWGVLFRPPRGALPLRMQWTQQKTVHTVADAPTASNTSSAVTTRTRVFLRTLSENPLLFDLMDVDEEPAENSHEIELVDNELNCQPCADTVTALIQHACTLPHCEWVRELAAGLRAAGGVPLAQMICNCREHLKPHSGALGGPLLELVASTPREDNGKKLLNSLHVDILETLLLWKDTEISPSEHLNSTIEYLINTCIDNDKYTNMLNWLTGLLNRVLEVYGKVATVPWRCFESLLTVREKHKTVLRILLVISKHKLHIPELIPTLIGLDERYWQEPKLAELFGQALACESETERPVSKYRQFMDRKRQRDEIDDYVKLLYYAQMGYPKICDEYHFKMILQLTARVVGHTKSKCLRIVSSYIALTEQSDLLSTLDISSLLRELPLETMKLVTNARSLLRGRVGRQIVGGVVPYVGNSDRNVRAQAVAVMLCAFEDLFAPKQGEHSAKRSRPNSSKLLNTIESPDTYTSSVINSIALAVTDSDVAICSSAREKVAMCLNSEDMKMRLAESFLLSLSVPAALGKGRTPSVCVSSYLDLLFRGLRANERFRESKLREEALDFRDPTSSKLLTNTRTYQGTFLSTTGRRTRVKTDQTASGINVQISIDDILGSIISFAKDKPDVSQALCTGIARMILASDRGFDARASLSRQACDVLSAVGDITPVGVEIARVLVEEIRGVVEFESVLDNLRDVTKCTEGEELVQLLYEEFRMRSDPDMFELGMYMEYAEMDSDINTPTFDDITSAFGKLANWDKLTIQQKNEVQTGGLPQLWVAEDTFKSWLAEGHVANSKSWFNKMLSSYRDECKQDSLRWLRETDRWPRRHFDISVVTELIEGSEWSEQEMKTRCDIRPSDCLVEWAARLMVRRAYATEQDCESSEIVCPSRSHELKWCKIANDRGLPHLAINCADFNACSAEENEQLSWQIEKARAMRIVGLNNNNVDMLGDALSLLELKENALGECSNNDVIMWNKMVAALHLDLGSITKQHLASIIETADKAAARSSANKLDKQTLSSIYEMGIAFYDDLWSYEPSEQNDLLNKMADILGHMIELDLTQRAEMFLAVIFNRLDEFSGELNEDTARNILEKISLLPHLDDTSLEQLKHHSPRFPPSVLPEYPTISAATSGGSGDGWRRQFQLVCDVRYSLLRRCEGLKRDINDPTKWQKSFDLLKDNIFENPFAAESSECNVLSKYKHDLYLIEDYDSTDTQQKTSTLNKILSELYKKCPPRATLRLSQLCPALANYSYTGSEQDASMSRLLGLGKLGVVKFYEQVSVFLDAVTRPVVLSALLTDGTVRRYIHKTGDRLRVDQSAQRVAASVKCVVGGEMLGYSVTPLGEDSGLIEFVENSTRLRDMINSVYDLGQVDIGARAEDDELILSSASLEHYRSFCSQVPAHALRSAIEASCSSTQDFINKKQMFVETLSTLTLLCWIFGLGDRHLENILYSHRTGSVWCVDWAAMFAFGARELCPARLTRTLQAVGDTKVLEARLQSLVSSLRNSSKLFLHVVKVSFKWMGDEFHGKYPLIEQYATGRATTRHVTKQTLLASDKPYKERIVKLLDDTFSDLEDKERYSVVEQVTCLLRQCTDPRILSVTRSGWEPWV